MATTFKTFLTNDVVSTRTMLHEAIPMTGTIASGTSTNKAGAEHNNKNYSHGMFQSVYDYPYLSSSANHIYDIAVGYSALSPLSGAASVQNSKKINIYNQMAQVLMGHSASGEILDLIKTEIFFLAERSLTSACSSISLDFSPKTRLRRAPSAQRS